MFADLIHLTGVLARFGFPSPPGWTQYVTALEWVLNELSLGLHSAGLAIIAFTLIVKTLLIPLTIQSIRSSRAMQELQPKIKELQKKYGKDRARISQETMRLYSEHHVNPMSGCLPMLIQLPIFWGVYRAIEHLSRGGSNINASDYWTHSFLWLPNLNLHDPYHILPIMAGVFQFVQTKMMKPAHQGKASDPQQAMMNQMMNFMPLMVVAFGWGFSSGPVIYWVTQSVFSVFQQWWITGWGSMLDWFPWLPDLPEHKRLGYRPPKPVEDVVVMSGEAAVPQRKGVMGWFQQKMEEAQQTAMERQAERTGTKSGSSTSTSKKPVSSSYQAKVDAEVDNEAAAARRNRARSGKKRTTPVKSAAGQADGAGLANGASEHAPANGAAPAAPPPPRKSRPARKKAAPGTGTGAGAAQQSEQT